MRISDWSSDVCSSDLERLQPRHDAVAQAVGRTDQRAARADAGVAQANAAAELGQLGHVHVALVDALQRILRRVEQEARRQLLMRSEESRVGKECVSTCRSGWSRYH